MDQICSATWEHPEAQTQPEFGWGSFCIQTFKWLEAALRPAGWQRRKHESGFTSSTVPVWHQEAALALSESDCRQLQSKLEINLWSQTAAWCSSASFNPITVPGFLRFIRKITQHLSQCHWGGMSNAPYFSCRGSQSSPGRSCLAVCLTSSLSTNRLLRCSACTTATLIHSMRGGRSRNGLEEGRDAVMLDWAPFFLILLFMFILILKCFNLFLKKNMKQNKSSDSQVSKSGLLSCHHSNSTHWWRLESSWKLRKKQPVSGHELLVFTPQSQEVAPLSDQCHGRRLQVGIFQWLHLWAGQEVVECSKGVWGPGHWQLIGWASGTDGRARAAQTLHVMHRSRHQITCRMTRRIRVTCMCMLFICVCVCACLNSSCTI